MVWRLSILAILLAACGDNLSPQVVLGGDPCDVAADCQGADGTCLTRACTDHVCTPTIAAKGTPVTGATGDCKRLECDGDGNAIGITDDTDVPASDDNTCTTEACVDGVPTIGNAPEATTCGTGGGMICNGSGTCVGCVNWTQCPGSDTDCKQRTCEVGACGFDFQPVNTPRTTQVAKDCKKRVCDGAGNGITIPDDADLPIDTNACTTDACTTGTPSNTPVAAGQSCGGTSQCDATGHCLQCVVASDCPGVDTECQVRTCSGAGVCGVANTPAATPIAQTAGDCHHEACDGSGVRVTPIDQTDIFDDSNACTDNVCSPTGVPSNPNFSAGTTCGASLQCDGSGACVGCLAPSDCPGPDTDCQTRSCTAGSCGFTYAAAGAPAPSMAQAGDCRDSLCGPTGTFTTATNDTDKPFDGNQCTSDVCTAGIPSNPTVATGQTCSQSGGSVCNPSGVCVQCNVPTDCAGADSACSFRSCSGAGTCGIAQPSAGTPVPPQTAGNCRNHVCNGTGGETDENNDLDKPVDGNVCTQDVCTMGAASNPNQPDGFGCDPSGKTCASGTCQVPAVVGWAPSDLWTGGTPCMDGVKFALSTGAGIDPLSFACSTTQGVFRGTRTAGSMVWANINGATVTNASGRLVQTHPASPGQIFYIGSAAATGNYFRSTNSGATFSPATLVDSLGNPRTIYSVRAQPTVSNMVGTWEPVGPHAQVLVGMNPPFVSHDVATATGTVVAMTGYLDAGSAIVFAAVSGDTPAGPQSATGGVFRSLDKGVSWVAANTGFAVGEDNLVSYVTIDPASPSTAPVMYVAMRGGRQIYKSTDPAIVWIQSNVGIPTGAQVNMLLVSPITATTVYAATTFGLYKSTDAGATWVLDGFPARNVLGVAVDPTLATNILAAVDDAVGVYKAN